MTTPELKPKPTADEVKWLLDLYKIYSDDLKKFETIGWQFPVALITGNFAAINWLKNDPALLVFLPLINYLFLLALTKHCHIRLGIVTAVRNIEGRLGKIFDDDQERLKQIFGNDLKCVADFSHTNVYWWLRIKTFIILPYGLILLNTVFFFGELWKLADYLKTFLPCCCS